MKSLQIQFLRISILRSKDFEFKRPFQSLKSCKKRQNNLTKDGVTWNILKATKFVTKVQKWGFMLRFGICVRGLSFKIMVPFLCFYKWGFFVKSLQIQF